MKRKRPDGYYVSVEVRDGDVEGATRVLRSKLQKSGFFREIKRRKYAETKGQKRRRKTKESISRMIRLNARLHRKRNTNRRIKDGVTNRSRPQITRSENDKPSFDRTETKSSR